MSEQMRALASLAPCMPCAPAQGLVTGTVPPPRSELAGGDGQGQEGQGWCGQNSGSSSGPTPQLGSAERSCEGQGWWAQEGPGRSVGARWPLGKGLGRGSGALAWPLGPERRDTSQLVACGPCSFRCQPWGRWGAGGADRAWEATSGPRHPSASASGGESPPAGHQRPAYLPRGPLLSGTSQSWPSLRHPPPSLVPVAGHQETGLP